MLNSFSRRKTITLAEAFAPAEKKNIFLHNSHFRLSAPMGFCLLKKCGKKKEAKPTPTEPTPPPAPPTVAPGPSLDGGGAPPPCNCCGHVCNLDQLSQIQRIKSIDLIRAKIYRLNYWDEDSHHYNDDQYYGTAPPPLTRSMSARSLPPPPQPHYYLPPPQYSHYSSPPPLPYYDQQPPPQRRYGPPPQRHFGSPPPRRQYAPPPPQYDYYGCEGRAPSAQEYYYGYGDY